MIITAVFADNDFCYRFTSQNFYLNAHYNGVASSIVYLLYDIFCNNFCKWLFNILISASCYFYFMVIRKPHFPPFGCYFILNNFYFRLWFHVFLHQSRYNAFECIYLYRSSIYAYCMTKLREINGDSLYGKDALKYS